MMALCLCGGERHILKRNISRADPETDNSRSTVPLDEWPEAEGSWMGPKGYNDHLSPGGTPDG